MRLLDDLHQFVGDFNRLVGLAERYLQLRLRSQGEPPGAVAALSDQRPFKARIEYYDSETVQRLEAATALYITKTGEWPSEEQRRAFIEENIDFSQEFV